MVSSLHPLIITIWYSKMHKLALKKMRRGSKHGIKLA
jgi:hypothetical protein